MNMKRARYLFKKWLKLDKKPLILLIVFAFEFVFPQISMAALPREAPLTQRQVYWSGSPRDELQESLKQRDFLPQARELKPRRIIYITVTAYSSTSDQTDDTPCITANGFDVCEHNQENIVAANFLPLGTKISFPDYFGSDHYFYVNDRMNTRYAYRLDIWMKSRQAAKQFGIRRLRMEIY